MPMPIYKRKREARYLVAIWFCRCGILALALPPFIWRSFIGQLAESISRFSMFSRWADLYMPAAWMLLLLVWALMSKPTRFDAGYAFTHCASPIEVDDAARPLSPLLIYAEDATAITSMRDIYTPLAAKKPPSLFALFSYYATADNECYLGHFKIPATDGEMPRK